MTAGQAFIRLLAQDAERRLKAEERALESIAERRELYESLDDRHATQVEEDARYGIRVYRIELDHYRSQIKEATDVATA